MIRWVHELLTETKHSGVLTILNVHLCVRSVCLYVQCGRLFFLKTRDSWHNNLMLTSISITCSPPYLFCYVSLYRMIRVEVRRYNDLCTSDSRHTHETFARYRVNFGIIVWGCKVDSRILHRFARLHLRQYVESKTRHRCSVLVAAQLPDYRLVNSLLAQWMRYYWPSLCSWASSVVQSPSVSSQVFILKSDLALVCTIVG